MREIFLVVEDSGHRSFLGALVQRLTREAGVNVEVHDYSVRGGSRVFVELARLVRDLQRGGQALPDALIVAVDANCKGAMARRRELEEKVPPELRPFTVFAVPDPHVERWMLVDAAAFKKVFGRGCSAPDKKCEKDRYKKALRQALAEAGVRPLLSGMEFADRIVEAMNLDQASSQDDSLDQFLADLKKKLQEWL